MIWLAGIGIIALYILGWLATSTIVYIITMNVYRHQEIGALVIANYFVMIWTGIYAIGGVIGTFFLGGMLL